MCRPHPNHARENLPGAPPHNMCKYKYTFFVRTWLPKGIFVIYLVPFMIHIQLDTHKYCMCKTRGTRTVGLIFHLTIHNSEHTTHQTGHSKLRIQNLQLTDCTSWKNCLLSVRVPGNYLYLVGNCYLVRSACVCFFFLVQKSTCRGSVDGGRKRSTLLAMKLGRRAP